MSSIMNLYDGCLHDGFSESQARRIASLFEEHDAGISRDVREIRTSVEVMKASIQSLERVIYGFGASMLGGFGLIIYFVKG